MYFAENCSTLYKFRVANFVGNESKKMIAEFLSRACLLLLTTNKRLVNILNNNFRSCLTNSF